MQLNRDYEKRDKIIFGAYEPTEYSGGVRRFQRLSFDKVKELVDNNFIDFDDAQNLAPTASMFYSFLKKYPFYYVGGYAVSPDRYDYRISFDELERSSNTDIIVTPEEDSDFYSFAENAEEEFDYACWFD